MTQHMEEVKGQSKTFFGRDVGRPHIALAKHSPSERSERTSEKSCEITDSTKSHPTDSRRPRWSARGRDRTEEFPINKIHPNGLPGHSVEWIPAVSGGGGFLIPAEI